MNIADIRKNTEQKMHKSLEALKVDLGKIRTGRAHPGILDHVMVDYYGTPTPIPQVANVSVIDARNLGVTPWDKKMIGPVDKAIRDSDLGLNPQPQGDVVRVPMPPLTEERRKELTKVVKHEAENAKVAIRNLRRDANNALKDLLKAKGVSEDEERRAQDEVQKMTNRYIAEVDKVLAAKEADLMSI
jgi:ribosome recycling factor